MLSSRTATIFKSIVEQYVAKAIPVPSQGIVDSCGFKVSSATIRNEMVTLTKTGFLNQPHTSAGRTPTPMALKYYVRELVKEEDLSVAEEVAVKEKVWDHRFETQKFLKEITRTLADKTKSLAISCTSDGDIFHSGYANILNNPEFYDIDVTREVLSLIDEFSALNAYFKKAGGEESVHILVGDDFESNFFSDLSIVFADFKTKNLNGSLGIIGPSRFHYPSIIPTIRYFGDLVTEIAKNW